MNSYDAPRPVSLQPFKTLKIVFMIVAIVVTVFLVVYGTIYGMMVGALGSLISSHNASGGEFFSIMSFGSLALFFAVYGIIAIACWVLFFVFKSKYKERLKHNRSLGIFNE